MRKFFFKKKLLNSAYLSITKQLVIENKQKYFLLTDHKLYENLRIRKNTKENERIHNNRWLTHVVGIIITIIKMYISNYKMYTMALRGKTSHYKILFQPTFLLSQLLYYFYQLWFLLPHDFVFTSITTFYCCNPLFYLFYFQLSFLLPVIFLFPKFSFLTSKHFSFGNCSFFFASNNTFQITSYFII